MRKYGMALLLTAAVIACAVLSLAVRGDDNEDGRREPIGTVEGLSIYRSQVAVSGADVQLMIAEKMLERLRWSIHQRIIEAACEEYGISLADEEVDEIRESIRESYERMGVKDEHLIQAQERARALIGAFKEWYEKDLSRSEVYENWDLAQFDISEREWEDYISVFFLYPEYADAFAEDIVDNVDDMVEQWVRFSKRNQLRQKLMEHIAADIQVNEDEIRALYEERFADDPQAPAYDRISGQLEAELLDSKREAALSEWLESRVKEADIQIDDQNIRALWESRDERFPMLPRRRRDAERQREPVDVEMAPPAVN